MPDRCVQIVEKRNGDEVTLSAALNGCTEATITLFAELQNATASQPLPVTVDAAGRQSFEIVRFERADANLPWHYKTRHFWQLGRRGDAKKGQAARPRRVVYALPYGKETHKVVQGWFGSLSHRRGSNDEYAIDFEMPVGTKVRAAREGTVVAVRQDSSVGGGNDKFHTSDNYIVVRHADGTFAEYKHLKHNGVARFPGRKSPRPPAAGLVGQHGLFDDAASALCGLQQHRRQAARDDPREVQDARRLRGRTPRRAGILSRSGATGGLQRRCPAW